MSREEEMTEDEKCVFLDNLILEWTPIASSEEYSKVVGLIRASLPFLEEYVGLEPKSYPVMAMLESDEDYGPISSYFVYFHPEDARKLLLKEWEILIDREATPPSE